ncbi:MAG: sugar ABC transporter permease [Treponema sp.]|nr:sugar ABC transporter permease [Treponema sp.]
MHHISLKKRKNLAILAFLFIPVGLLLLFTYYPATRLIYYSFTNYNGLDSNFKFVGLSNYITFLTDPQYYTIFLHLAVLFVVGLIQMVLAFLLALLLNTKIRGRNAFRSVIFMPYIISSVVVAFMFGYFFSTNFGVLNTLLKNIGLGGLAQNWLGNPKLVNWVMGFMSLWKYVGFTMIIFLAALQSIPQEMLEAGRIDGASSFKQLIYLILPSIRPVIALCLFLNLNGVLGAFEFQFITWPLGITPLNMADTFVTKTYVVAFKYSKYGMGSAMGVILAVLVGILAWLQNKLIPKES